MHIISKPIGNENTFYYKNFLILLVRRRYQRTIYLYVTKNNSIQVRCGLRTSLKEICHFIDHQHKWIQNELVSVYKEKLRFPQKKLLPGECFYFCGELKKLRYFKSSKISFETKDEFLNAYGPNLFLNEDKWYKQLKTFYQKSGASILKQKINTYSHKMKLFPTKVSFRCQKSLFGSCSEEGCISLNWSLVAAPHSIMNYIVIHELAHLKYMDHSKNFWKLVKQYDPHYLKSKQWLNNNKRYFEFIFEFNLKIN